MVHPDRCTVFVGEDMGTRGRTNEIKRHLVLRRRYDVKSYFVFPFNLFNMYADGIQDFSSFSTFRRTAVAGWNTSQTNSFARGSPQHPRTPLRLPMTNGYRSIDLPTTLYRSY